MLHSRQRRLLQILLLSPTFVSDQQLGDMLKVSLRTIQREIQSLRGILSRHGLKIVRKTGSGMAIEGREEDKQRLLKSLNEMEKYRLYSPEERQEGLIFGLLLAGEPVKL
ncbi:MAG: HTH domain-containing protein [Planifilum fulgidum]